MLVIPNNMEEDLKLSVPLFIGEVTGQQINTIKQEVNIQLMELLLLMTSILMDCIGMIRLSTPILIKTVIVYFLLTILHKAIGTVQDWTTQVVPIHGSSLQINVLHLMLTSIWFLMSLLEEQLDISQMELQINLGQIDQIDQHNNFMTTRASGIQHGKRKKVHSKLIGSRYGI